jgi:hypothetical protein
MVFIASVKNVEIQKIKRGYKNLWLKLNRKKCVLARSAERLSMKASFILIKMEEKHSIVKTA